MNRQLRESSVNNQLWASNLLQIDFFKKKPQLLKADTPSPLQKYTQSTDPQQKEVAESVTNYSKRLIYFRSDTIASLIKRMRCLLMKPRKTSYLVISLKRMKNYTIFGIFLLLAVMINFAKTT